MNADIKDFKDNIFVQKIVELTSNLMIYTTMMTDPGLKDFHQDICNRVNKYVKIKSFTLEKGEILERNYKLRKLRYYFFFFFSRDRFRILRSSVLVFEEQFMSRT